MKTLGELIKNYRKEQGLSLRDFEALCGISHSYIAKLEKGIDRRTGNPIEPTLDLVEKIAKAMGLPLNSLLYAMGKINNSDIDKQSEDIKADAAPIEDEGILTSNDLKQIMKTVEKLRANLKNDPNMGYANFDGDYNEYLEELELLEASLNAVAKTAKKLNKVTYGTKTSQR